MKINTSKLKDQYVHLQFEELTISVKLDDEGVVIDLTTCDGEVIASTWKTYQEMIDGEDEDETVHN